MLNLIADSINIYMRMILSGLSGVSEGNKIDEHEVFWSVGLLLGRKCEEEDSGSKPKDPKNKVMLITTMFELACLWEGCELCSDPKRGEMASTSKSHGGGEGRGGEEPCNALPGFSIYTVVFSLYTREYSVFQYFGISIFQYFTK